jgi:hypothetical protein
MAYTSIVTAILLCRRICIATRGCTSSATSSEAQAFRGQVDRCCGNAGEPDKLVAELAEDEAIAAAGALLLTVPNQLGVDYTPTEAAEGQLLHWPPVTLGTGGRVTRGPATGVS